MSRLPSATTLPYWSAWTTLAFYALFVFVALAAGTLAVFGYLLINVGEDMDASQISTLGAQSRDVVLLWSLWIIAICQCVVVFALVRLRKGTSLQDYLGLHPITGRVLLPWLGMTVALITAFDLTQLAVGRPVVPDVMIDQYTNTRNLVLLWSVAVFAGPVWEEIVFRGFLMAGFVNSRLGHVGGILLTTVLWAVLHLQYDAFGIASVAITGILFGFARMKTGSTLVPVAMHVFGNLIAFSETAFIVAFRR